MNFRNIILTISLILSFSLITNEFILPKNDLRVSNKVPAKKTRELILEQIADVLKNLLKNDRSSLDLRSFFQEELEISLCGDENSLVGSSSKSKLQETLNLLQEINQHLIDVVKKDQVLSIKIKKLKAEKLKGS